jgi:hypothetical protein
MKVDSIAKLRADRVWLTEDHCRLDEFDKLVDRRTSLADYPMASGVEDNVLVYEGDAARSAAADPESRRALLAEWAEAMLVGPASSS